MTREERIKFARESLLNDHSKRVLDELLEILPKDILIWFECGDENNEVWLEYKGGATIIKIHGFA